MIQLSKSKVRLNKLLLLLFFSLTLLTCAWANTYTVTTTADAGASSLRQAILNANSSPTSEGTVVISFQIPTSESTTEGGTQFWRIAPQTSLPAITREAVFINGSSQKNFAGDKNPFGPEIELRGPGSSWIGLEIRSANCTIEGLVINKFSGGIMIINPTAYNNRIIGNYIGTDVSGTVDMGNGLDGILIANEAKYNVIGGMNPAERNLISGNNDNGVYIDIGCTSNEVYGNYIGTDITGTAPLGNSSFGVLISTGKFNKIGGTTAGARNIISSNGLEGIRISGLTGSSNEVSGNYIGTTVTGEGNLGNSRHGIGIISAFNNKIGPGNYIANNGTNSNYHGISISGSTSDYNTITQNSIFNNYGLGIMLSVGGNNEIPAPTVTSVSYNPSIASTEVSGNGAGNSATVEVFATNGPDTSGSGEGKSYLGSTIANASGDWLITVEALTAGTTLCATTTHTNGNTSMFSYNVTVESAAAAGLITSLSISRESDAINGNIIISWSTSPEGSPVDLYRLATTDATASIYTNEATAWGSPIYTNLTLSATKELTQVGTGFAQAYYKVIPTGQTALFSTAEAVGKINITSPLYPPSLELIAVPLIPATTEITSVIGDQFSPGNAEVWCFFNAPTSGWRSHSYNGSTWSGSLPGNLMPLDRGFWMKSTTTSKVITVVGNVPNEDRNISFNTETLFFYGNSYPVIVPWTSTGLDSIFNTNDQVWQWDNGWKSKNYDGSNTWSGTTLPGLMIRHGFWIIKHSEADTWTYPKPY